jgi:phosphoribosylaminoimidazole (AIR) synthetase
VYPLIEKKLIKGLAHITGSGFLNVPRISDRVSYDIELPPSAERPAVFQWVEDRSQLSFEELSQTVNLGIGLVLVTSPQKSTEVLKKLKRSGEAAWVLGEVIRRQSKQEAQVFLRDGKNSVTLS